LGATVCVAKLEKVTVSLRSAGALEGSRGMNPPGRTLDINKPLLGRKVLL
jgi:hypothetical protein